MNTKIIMFPITKPALRRLRDGDVNPSDAPVPIADHDGSGPTNLRVIRRRTMSATRGGQQMKGTTMMDAEIMATLLRPMFSTGFDPTPLAS